MGYYQKALKALEEKKLVDFVANVTSSIAESNNNEELARCLFLKAKGLFQFKLYEEALEVIDETLEYDSPWEFELQKYQGIILGYLGKPQEAAQIFEELLSETKDINQMVGLYTNLAWVNDYPEEWSSARYWLMEALDVIEKMEVKDDRKWRVFNNFGTICFYQKDFEQAKRMFKKAIKVCPEESVAHIYVNLAEVHLQIDQEGIHRKVNEYLNKAEILASRFKDDLVMGYVFKTKALVEEREQQIFQALDTLYLAFEFFKSAQAYSQATDCLLEIQNLSESRLRNSIKSLHHTVEERIKGTKMEVRLLKGI